jgi:hypothetical protein
LHVCEHRKSGGKPPQQTLLLLLVKLKPRGGDFAYKSDGSPLILDLYLLWHSYL